MGYLKPWRRKFGCVTLLLACAFTAGWVRSLYIEDMFMLPIRSAPTVLISRRSGIAWATEDAIPPVKMTTQFMWAAEPAVAATSKDPFAELDKLDWRRDFIGFHFCGSLIQENGMSVDVRWYVIPYWSISIPLTLISVWLFLSKPHQSNRTKITEPAAIEAT